MLVTVRCPACQRELELGASTCAACFASVERVHDATTAPLVGETSSTEALDPTASRCPLHPELLAAGTCERCGRFVCVRCAPDVLPRGHGSCTECVERRDREVGGIGGWLLLPAIYAVLMPTASVGVLTALAVLPSLRSLVTHGSMAIVGLWACSTLALAVMFFRKKRQVPPFYLVVLALQVVSATVSDGNVPRAVVVALVLGPYLVLSPRVKATFVR
jgi:hypothetical protein